MWFPFEADLTLLPYFSFGKVFIFIYHVLPIGLNINNMSHFWHNSFINYVSRELALGFLSS